MPTQSVGRPMLLGGQWVYSDRTINILDPHDNSLVDIVPAATREQVETAIEDAQRASKVAAEMTSYDRMSILKKAAAYVEENLEEYAKLLSKESSKTIRESRKEVRRCIETLTLSAEEATRIEGETLSFDQSPSGQNRIGYFYRLPVGLIVAITPFNDPLNLVAHKVGPAIAGGNAIIVKPATVTPLSALKLAEAFEAAGLPPNILSVVTGHGSEIGDILVSHPAVRMVTFTGGLNAGEHIMKLAGLKKISMELGSNSPVIVLEDAILDDAVEASVSGAFWAAGQNCLGVQRIFVESSVYDEFLSRFIERTQQIRVGEKELEDTDMGPMITEKEACRIEEWILEALEMGAQIHTGGTRKGSYYAPTVLTNVPLDCQVAMEEVFGPVVSIFKVDSLDEAIELANGVSYGLQAGIFTSDIEHAFQAIRRLEVGGVMINDSSDYRLDAMPFGGVKGSGVGREGVKFALHEMTELKVVCFKLTHPLANKAKV
ncbi:aldehyde dehydrogenase family protein [Alicyclobacillus sp. ALC3]|uniref:aldehyde dehydrogenase family protein n=1 Tax=Alicyclobacillus sp. ALC3 TaxID=2796143 RepID=UPI0023784E18|nr:aldehyde dehydrogenase family protein [Alicyclobacillus sp. ALC3]WDL98547.1 aldehyde dehydrogenase family protein [Alicyclobacillus sp. ALC3]